MSGTGLSRKGMNEAGVTRCISTALGVTFASTSVAGMSLPGVIRPELGRPGQEGQA